MPAFDSRWGGLGLGVWPEEGMDEAGVNPNFDPQGCLDVGLPLWLAMWAFGAVFKALEARLYAGLDEEEEEEGRKGGRRVTHVFCTGVVARVLLLLLPWLPYPFLRRRWDWFCTAPTVYETVAHLYHWRDTTSKLKWSLLGHHVAVLLVVWPLARVVEATPYPVSALSMVLFFEVGSAWSYLSYLVKSRGPRVLDAVGLREMEGHIIPGLIWLCYAGQRAMRGAAIWEGIVFLDENPEFARARALQVVMIALELHGAWRCFKHLPSLGDTAAAAKSSSRSSSGSRNSTPTKRGGGGSGGGRSRRGSSPTGKQLRVKAARVAPAADGSPNGSPRSSVA